MTTTQSSKNAKYSPFLTPEQKEKLSRYKHVFDYPLSKEELEFIEKNGYLVVKKVVEKELCQRAVNEIFTRAKQIYGVDKEDSNTWENIAVHGFMELWHLPSFYELRTHPKLYSIFAQLLKTHRLGVSLDRTSLKSPILDGEEEAIEVRKLHNAELVLHNDCNLWYTDTSKGEFQMGIALADCPPGGGGFYCIPGFNDPAEIEKYQKKYMAGRFGRKAIPDPDSTFNSFHDGDYTNERKIEVPLEEGDIVIWNTLLPHSGGYNCLKNHWRLHAYVRFLALDGPNVTAEVAKWNNSYMKNSVLPAMIKGSVPSLWSTRNPNRRAPENRLLEVPYHKKPELSELGQKIFGEIPWEK